MTKQNKIILASFILAFASSGFAQEAAASNPEGLKAIGKGVALGLGALATGIAQARIGSGAVGAIAEDPSSFGRMLIMLLLPETLVIFGFLGLFLI